MKIDPKGMGGVGRNFDVAALQENGKAGKTSAQMDKIEISAGQGNTVQFIEQLKAQISKEVRVGMPKDELDALKEQISDGEYELNSIEIARSILWG